MLAGIVMQLCLGSVTGMAANPWAVGPVVIVWVLALRLAPRWASPLAFVAAPDLFGDLADRPGFTEPYLAALTALRASGARAVLQELLAR